jgi:8-oxo-dGTP pyrophosphatase MutT (NUDIX family)
MNTDFEQIIDSIQLRLQQPLPGKEAQVRMAPSLRNYTNIIQNNPPIQSAVLLLLYPRDRELLIAYFKRPEYDGHHSGQIAFPGGKWEEKDNTLQETALRETQEEFGLNPERIKILGKLSPLFIPISNMEVTPFVGYINHSPTFTPQPEEVSYIIEIPLKCIIDNTKKTCKVKHRNNIEIETPMYIFENEEIWGATAMITSEFEEIIKGISSFSL